MNIFLLLEDGSGDLLLEVVDKLLLEESTPVPVAPSIGGDPVWKPLIRPDYFSEERLRYRNVRVIEDSIASIYFYK